MPNKSRAKATNVRRAKGRWAVLSKPLGLQPGDKLLGPRRSWRKKYPPLTRDQQKLVEEHQWIAGRLAHSAKAMTGGYTGCFARQDLESVAYFALCVAATRYDPELGWKFSTFAWNTARGYIQHALRDHSRLVRVPRWIMPIRAEVRQMLTDGATYDEVCEELGLTHQQVLLCEESWQEIHSSYDHTPDERRPREFIYEIDEARAMIGEDVLKALGNLPDSDLSLLLAHVEGELEGEDEIARANELLTYLRSLVDE
jgi:DNA-directed RNA polymerase specialized sigma subunit